MPAGIIRYACPRCGYTKVAYKTPDNMECSSCGHESLASCFRVEWQIRNQAHKADKGKPRFNLIPLHHLEGVAMIREYGVNKYGTRDGWRDVTNAKERYEEAMTRHWFAYLSGEELDEESGLPHIDHVICNLLFLKEFQDVDNNKRR